MLTEALWIVICMVNKLPKLNEQQLTLGVSRLSDLYHKLTLDLFDQVVDRLTERGTTSLEENPYIWQLEKMSNMGLLNDENIRLIAERSQIAEELIREVISGEGYKIYQDTRQQLAESMGIPLPNGGNQVFDRLESLVNQTIYDMDNLVNTTLPRSVQNVYKSAIEETVAKVVIGVSTPKEALSETLMKWHEKGFYGFTDKAGRSWRADSYARTVIQSTTYRAYNEARMAPAKELGVDTYYYSVKSAAREMCAPLQHQIVTTGGARTEEGVRILALSDYGYGSPGGCLGINCAHTLTPFLPGINEKPDLPPWLENLTPERAIENANVQAKQRALEREIRRNKERLHVAEKLGDQELVQKYQLKGKTLDSAMKDWEGKHSFLHRDKDRERINKNTNLNSAEKDLFNGIIGLRTKDGSVVQSMSEHALERFLERKIHVSDVKRSLESPLNSVEIIYDKEGRPSKKYIGKKITVVVNPETGKIITAHKTRKNIRKKYGVYNDETDRDL